MKAVVIEKPGSLDNIAVRDYPLPEPPPGWVRVKVAYAALNHMDIHSSRGIPNTPYPHVLGADGSGTIESVGEGVDAGRIGQKVLFNPTVSCGECEYCQLGEESMCLDFKILAEHMDGGLADYTVLPAQNALPIPEGYDLRRAAAIGVVYVTAWRMLKTLADIQPGEICLILGIGAGVSVAGLQLARELGARVWVTSSSEEKLAKALELGAEWGVNYREADWSKEAYFKTGKRGVDVIFDSVGGETFEHSIRTLRRGGRLINCGATAGRYGKTDLHRLFVNQLKIFGSTMGSVAEFAEMLNYFGPGSKIEPLIDREYASLDEAPEAIRYLSTSKQMGKVLVKVAG